MPHHAGRDDRRSAPRTRGWQPGGGCAGCQRLGAPEHPVAIAGGSALPLGAPGRWPEPIVLTGWSVGPSGVRCGWRVRRPRRCPQPVEELRPAALADLEGLRPVGHGADHGQRFTRNGDRPEIVPRVDSRASVAHVLRRHISMLARGRLRHNRTGSRLVPAAMEVFPLACTRSTRARARAVRKRWAAEASPRGHLDPAPRVALQQTWAREQTGTVGRRSGPRGGGTAQVG